MAPSGGRPQVEEIDSRGVAPVIIAEPGASGTFDVSRSGWVEIVSGGVETRVLPDPTFRGQILDLVFITDGGTVTVTSSSPVNQTGNNTITFTDVGEHTRLVGAWNATDGFEWKTIVNDGAALTTV